MGQNNVTCIPIVRFEVSTAVTMMIIIFWEMTPCGYPLLSNDSVNTFARSVRMQQNGVHF
jgi:hypothetical protein